jgi:hypothetical protein
MPGKSQDGFTKAAQKSKFIRNRDIKLTHGEAKKEALIQKGMAEGICQRCREKAQWRFRYDKYKPLSKPATCQNCKQKVVVKAYRTFCDKCALSKKVCPGCCKPPGDDVVPIGRSIISDETMDEESKDDEADYDEADKIGEGDDDDIDIEAAKFISEGLENEEAGLSRSLGKIIKIVNEIDTSNLSTKIILDQDTVNATIEGSSMVHSQAAEFEISPSQAVAEWDEKSFAQFATSKYNKNRVVGSAEDSVFTFPKP